MMERNYYLEILSYLPQDVLFACAYGSGAFKQLGHASEKENMLDFILVVKDTKSWHEANLNMNSHHYSAMKHLGSDKISSLNDNYGAFVYFNPYVNINGRLVKYGVISESNFTDDLLNWKTLYIAGRLQKPVNCLIGLNGLIQSSLNKNLTSAIHASLLMLPEKFTDYNFYEKIASLSYTGDFRMIIGEDKGKVKNIVGANMEHFQRLYHPLMTSISSISTNNGQFSQDKSIESIEHHIKSIPGIIRQPCDNYIKDNKKFDILNLTPIITSAIANIIRPISWKQSIKGILTAGGLKTSRYALSKLLKMTKGALRK